MEPIRVALLGAGSRGKHIYADWARNHPDEMKLVAVAEPNDDKRNAVIAEHRIDQEYAVKDWQDLFFKKPLEIDAVIIATQDQMHKQAILAAIDHDYHILCEKKPIVTNEADAKEIAKKSAGFSKVFLSLVMYYVILPFFHTS